MLSEKDFYFEQEENERIDAIIDYFDNMIKKATRFNVYLECVEYKGEIFSYTTIRKPISATIAALALTEPKEEKVDIQSTLGEQGDSLDQKYKVSIKSDNVPNYSFVLMYIKHGASEFPLTIVLDEDVSCEINKEYYDNNSYIYSINNSSEMRSLFDRVFSTSRIKGIIQSLITLSYSNISKDNEE